MAQMLTTLTLHVDTSAAQAAMARLAALAEGRPQVGERFLGLLDAGEELFALQEDHGGAAGAGQLFMRLEPSDGLLGRLGAEGAGDV